MQRYKFNYPTGPDFSHAEMEPRPTGEWVRFSDHQSSLAEREQRIAQYQEALGRIAHFGQDTESKLFGADAMRMREIARAALATEGEKR